MNPNPTLFLADDDPDDIGFLKDSLIERNANVNITTFDNGLVLLNYLVHNPEIIPDMITLDINMPVKNGFLTLHELKENPALKSIPVIMLTASARQEDEERCRAMGCLSYFIKPHSVTEYTDLAERILLLCQKQQSSPKE